jgi:hypothetical protein
MSTTSQTPSSADSAPAAAAAAAATPKLLKKASTSDVKAVPPTQQTVFGCGMCASPFTYTSYMHT